MKRLIVLSALVLLLASLAPAALADEAEADGEMTVFSAAQEWKAEMIAEYLTAYFQSDPEVADLDVDDPGFAALEVTVEDVWALRTGDTAIGHPVGWGALYKVLLYIGPEGLAELDSEGGLAIGQLRKTYLASLAEGDEPAVKNLGQLNKETKAKSGKVPPGLAKKSG
ncbi:MAG: hypothetical protein ABFR89_01095 [Actinomycetota bacterium]